MGRQGPRKIGGRRTALISLVRKVTVKIEILILSCVSAYNVRVEEEEKRRPEGGTNDQFTADSS
jgi:hypothetical protein